MFTHTLDLYTNCLPLSQLTALLKGTLYLLSLLLEKVFPICNSR